MNQLMRYISNLKIKPHMDIQRNKSAFPKLLFNNLKHTIALSTKISTYIKRYQRIYTMIILEARKMYLTPITQNAT
jgi:hypothetical protein